MATSRNRLSRFLTDSHCHCEPVVPFTTNFYREEIIKRQRCLEQQRECYSERAISDAERALAQVMDQLDRLCTTGDADKVVGRLLCQFDLLTGLSAWTDPSQVN